MSLDLAECDRARLARDPSYDRRFYTGVHPTGIYCRPVCPVRPARSANVSFFPSAAAGAPTSSGLRDRRLGRLADRAVDLLAGEAGGRGIAAHDRLALLVGDDVVDVLEAVGRARLDRVDDAFRTA